MAKSNEGGGCVECLNPSSKAMWLSGEGPGGPIGYPNLVRARFCEALRD